MADQPDPDDDLIPENENRPADTGLYCFMDLTRPCNSSCAAFVTFPKRAQSSELGEQSSHCSLLSSVERVGRNTTIIAEILHKQQKKSADQARETNLTQSVTSPFGKTRP